jgi:hypothetical protein
MSIIRMVDWIPPVTTTFNTVQDFRENPDGPYRELLMASVVDPETGEETPVPYFFDGDLDATGRAYLRIPHALSIAQPGDGTNAATVAQSRIPDVVIPMAVVDVEDLNPPGAAIAPAWNTNWLIPPSSTGMFADENFIYVGLVGAGGATCSLHFVIYVEYTHSMVRNEIVTYEYYRQEVPAP